MNSEKIENDILLFHRTFTYVLYEQKKITFTNFDLDYTLREFVDLNIKENLNNNIFVLYGCQEILYIDSIIIDGKMRFNQHVESIKIKDILSELNGEKLIVICDDSYGVGGDSGEVYSLVAQTIRSILDIIGLYFVALQTKDYLESNFITPIKLRSSVNKKNEWSLNEFCQTFEVDSIKQAGKILRSCGFKKDISSNNYISKSLYNSKKN